MSLSLLGDFPAEKNTRDKHPIITAAQPPPPHPLSHTPPEDQLSAIAACVICTDRSLRLICGDLPKWRFVDWLSVSVSLLDSPGATDQQRSHAQGPEVLLGV